MSGHRDELMTIESYAALWAKVTERRVTSYRQFSLEEAVEAGVPDWLAAEVLAGGRFNGEYGTSGGDPEVKTPAECGVDVQALGTVEEWMRAEDWGGVL